MSDLSKSNANHGKLLAQSILLANKVIDELSQTVEINQKQISDLYQKNEFVSHVAKQNQDDIRKFKEAEGWQNPKNMLSLKMLLQCGAKGLTTFRVNLHFAQVRASILGQNSR